MIEKTESNLDADILPTSNAGKSRTPNLAL